MLGIKKNYTFNWPISKKVLFSNYLKLLELEKTYVFSSGDQMIWVYD